MRSVFNNRGRKYWNLPKTRRFLGYGIGEVILIVIGVLIAVSLNNFNENLKKRKDLEGILEVLKQDFSRDTLVINEILEFYEVRRSIFRRIVQDSMSKQDILECLECDYVITGHRIFRPNTTGYRLLQKHLDEDSNKDQLEFIRFMQSYAELLSQLELMENNVIEDVNQTLEHWRDHYSWFADFIQNPKTEKYIDYRKNSQDYKNRTAYYYVLVYQNYLPVLESYRNIVTEFISSSNDFK